MSGPLEPPEPEEQAAELRERLLSVEPEGEEVPRDITLFDWEGNPGNSYFDINDAGNEVVYHEEAPDYCNVLTREAISCGVYFFEFLMHKIGDEQICGLTPDPSIAGEETYIRDLPAVGYYCGRREKQGDLVDGLACLHARLATADSFRHRTAARLRRLRVEAIEVVMRNLGEVGRSLEPVFSRLFGDQNSETEALYCPDQQRFLHVRDGDVVGMLVDCDNHHVVFYHNGVKQGQSVLPQKPLYLFTHLDAAGDRVELRWRPLPEELQLGSTFLGELWVEFMRGVEADKPGRGAIVQFQGRQGIVSYGPDSDGDYIVLSGGTFEESDYVQHTDFRVLPYCHPQLRAALVALAALLVADGLFTAWALASGPGFASGNTGGKVGILVFLLLLVGILHACCMKTSVMKLKRKLWHVRWALPTSLMILVYVAIGAKEADVLCGPEDWQPMIPALARFYLPEHLTVEELRPLLSYVLLLPFTQPPELLLPTMQHSIPQADLRQRKLYFLPEIAAMVFLTCAFLELARYLLTTLPKPRDTGDAGVLQSALMTATSTGRLSNELADIWRRHWYTALFIVYFLGYHLYLYILMDASVACGLMNVATGICFESWVAFFEFVLAVHVCTALPKYLANIGQKQQAAATQVVTSIMPWLGAEIHLFKDNVAMALCFAVGHCEVGALATVGKALGYLSVIATWMPVFMLIGDERTLRGVRRSHWPIAEAAPAAPPGAKRQEPPKVGEVVAARGRVGVVVSGPDADDEFEVYTAANRDQGYYAWAELRPPLAVEIKADTLQLLESLFQLAIEMREGAEEEAEEEAEEGAEEKAEAEAQGSLPGDWAKGMATALLGGENSEQAEAEWDEFLSGAEDANPEAISSALWLSFWDGKLPEADYDSLKSTFQSFAKRRDKASRLGGGGSKSELLCVLSGEHERAEENRQMPPWGTIMVDGDRVGVLDQGPNEDGDYIVQYVDGYDTVPACRLVTADTTHVHEEILRLLEELFNIAAEVATNEAGGESSESSLSAEQGQMLASVLLGGQEAEALAPGEEAAKLEPEAWVGFWRDQVPGPSAELAELTPVFLRFTRLVKALSNESPESWAEMMQVLAEQDPEGGPEAGAEIPEMARLGDCIATFDCRQEEEERRPAGPSALWQLLERSGLQAAFISAMPEFCNSVIGACTIDKETRALWGELPHAMLHSAFVFFFGGGLFMMLAILMSATKIAFIPVVRTVVLPTLIKSFGCSEAKFTIFCENAPRFHLFQIADESPRNVVTLARRNGWLNILNTLRALGLQRPDDASGTNLLQQLAEAGMEGKGEALRKRLEAFGQGLEGSLIVAAQEDPDWVPGLLRCGFSVQERLDGKSLVDHLNDGWFSPETVEKLQRILKENVIPAKKKKVSRGPSGLRSAASL